MYLEIARVGEVVLKKLNVNILNLLLNVSWVVYSYQYNKVIEVELQKQGKAVSPTFQSAFILFI